MRGIFKAVNTSESALVFIRNEESSILNNNYVVITIIAFERVAMSLPLWYKGLTPELRKFAEDTLGETPEVREKGLRELRALIEDRDDVYSRTDDVFLLRFLRTKKYDVPKALRLLLNYYNFREKQNGAFVGNTPSEMKHILQMNTMLYSPRRTQAGSHVAVYRMGSFDVSRATAQELVAAVLLVSEMTLECEATQVSGGVFVLDLAGMSVHHYSQFVTIPFLSFAISTIQDCLPERLRNVHFVNEPFIFHAVFRVIKPLLKKKLKERIRFHGRNLNSLHECVSKDLLPKELGGHLDISDYSVFSDHFLSQESFIESVSKFGMVGKENKRL